MKLDLNLGLFRTEFQLILLYNKDDDLELDIFTYTIYCIEFL